MEPRNVETIFNLSINKIFLIEIFKMYLIERIKNVKTCKMEKMFLILLFTRLSIISPYTLENI